MLLLPSKTFALQCAYQVNNDWGSGFTSNITVTNDSATAINGWQVQWKQNGGSTVTSSWNASLSGTNPYTASNVNWNGVIAPGAAQSFGIQGNGDNSTGAIVSCTAAGGATSSRSSIISSSARSSLLSSRASSSQIAPHSSRSSLSSAFSSVVSSSVASSSVKSSSVASFSSSPIGPEVIPKSIISSSFRNPLYGNGADPWLTYFQGNYYLSTTTWTSQLSMRKSPTLAGLSTAEPVNVWSDTEASRCCQFWAFEFHRLNGPNGYRWYLMYTAGNKDDLNGQKLHVLESAADDPMGPFAFKRTLLPNRWNIDGTYLEHNNRLYLLWSEWYSGDQSLWIAQMTDPWTVNTQTIKLLARPTYSWEQWNKDRINEAPEIIKHNGRTFMSFSAAPCHTPEYKLGLMELTGNDPLNPNHWVKDAQPAFQQGNGVFGTGHNGFFKSPNGEQDWLVYHGNAAANQGCGNTRSVRAQPITWDNSGKPQFGQPVSTNTQVNVPAGEAGPIVAEVQGIAYQLRNTTTGQCASLGKNGYLKQDKCVNIQDAWTLDPTFDGYYRLGHKTTGEFLSVRDCQTSNGALANLSPWYTNGCQQWNLSQNNSGNLTFNHRVTKQTLGLSQCANDASVALGSQCNQWQLEPKEAFAVVSLVSGKVLEVSECSTGSSASMQQWEWLNSPCQMWQAQPVDGGYVQLKPTHNPSSCLEYAAGAKTLIQGTCGSQNSHWRIDPLAKGAVRILSRTSNKVLDVANCGLANGTAIGTYDWLDNDCQKFFLRSVE